MSQSPNTKSFMWTEEGHRRSVVLVRSAGADAKAVVFGALSAEIGEDGCGEGDPVSSPAVNHKAIKACVMSMSQHRVRERGNSSCLPFDTNLMRSRGSATWRTPLALRVALAPAFVAAPKV